MAQPILQIQELCKSFGGIFATDHASLDVFTGEIHAIIGPNGAGKTTLISQLSGALQPDSGHIIFEGKDISGQKAHTRSQVGIARSFQITSVFMDMTVLDNVALAVQAHDGHSFKFWRAARTDLGLREPAFDILKTVGLDPRAAVIVSELSHGERRQLEIAMALATKPRFLLLDEPMAGMGPDESQRMVKLLDGLRGEKTMLLVEHDMDAVFALADRISVLVAGRIIATDVPDAIRANDEVRRAYLGEEAADA